MKQAPAWNKVTTAFASNNGVAFGDINLSEQQIRGNHNPGAGGWPTIRYFNAKTGYEGQAYDKKTSGAMCDELGNDEYMQAYVEEAGGVSLCSIADGAGCSEKENSFIEKWKARTVEDATKEHARLKVRQPPPAGLRSRARAARAGGFREGGRAGGLTPAARAAQGMDGGKMKPDLQKWLKQRTAILKQYAGAGEVKSEL